MLSLTKLASAALLVFATTICSAQECKPTLVTMLEFAPNSAEVDSAQIASLAVWIEKAYKSHPSYAVTIVEGTAIQTDRDAKALARRRAVKAEAIVRALMRTSAPTEVSAHVFKPGDVSNDGNYAAIQLVPDSAPATLACRLQRSR